MADRSGELKDSERGEDIVEKLKDKISQGGEIAGLLHAISKDYKKDLALSKKSWEHCIPISIPEVIKVPTMEHLKKHILHAAENKQVLRVAGALHSASMQQYVEEGGKPLLLTRDFRKIITWEESNEVGWLYCKAGGGCHLGSSVLDPEGATWEESVCFKINEKGFAFPILGGIIEQTVSGFMMTGSAGGSLKHGFSDVIQEIEFVDGTGECRKASKNDDDKDLFNAVGVSMGLFGVITSVTFRVGRKFYVEGVEENVTIDDSILKDGATLETNLKTKEYLRVNWFPQKFVNRVMQWTGQKVDPNEEKLHPYRHPLASPLMSIGAWLVLLVNNCILGSYGQLTDEHLLFVAFLLSGFVPLCSKQEFFDRWWHALPGEQQAPNNTIIRVDFTEIWLPMGKCQDVLDKLSSMFQDPKAAGNFATEIYGAKKSDFWLSMSYGEDMVRVDPYWFHWNSGDKRKFFTNFWNALLPLDEHVRLHWGKWLPEPGQICGDKVFNLAYLKTAFPKMEEWLELRKKYDPNNVFLTDYWRKILEIP